MDRFSSCYFCGGALDASLSEYPVVPREFQPPDGDGSTVVLCSTCRHKLGAVVEDVVAATTDRSVAADDDNTTLPGEWESPAADTDQGDGAPIDAETDSPTAPDSTDAETDSTTAPDSADAETADDGTPEAAQGDQTSDDGPTMTKLEYNKVMRLLQNREFPVDRAEIRTVAHSAYDIGPDEFDTVVDAAIDRGLITERDGQFVTPD